MLRAALRNVLAAVLLTGLAGPAGAQPRRPGSATPPRRVTEAAAYWAAQLSTACPLAAPGDEAALARCRQALFGHAGLRRRLPAFLLWGRQRDPDALLRDSALTQLAPDVWLGLYLPLFMFDGKHTVEYVARDGLYLVRIPVGFRNRLPPGQFPYPFWHEEEKWSFYQRARQFLLWLDPATGSVKVAQYTPHADTPALVETEPVVAGKFDGRWMWKDRAGKLQPQVTLFDGLFSDANPYKAKLDVAYRDLATRMRAGQCSSCHVPNNPFKMKKLVLLQTPAHAAGEIGRVLQSVRENRMPLDQAGTAIALPPETRKALLESGTRFASLVDAAKRWEQRSRARTAKQK